MDYNIVTILYKANKFNIISGKVLHIMMRPTADIRKMKSVYGSTLFIDEAIVRYVLISLLACWACLLTMVKFAFMSKVLFTI